MEHLTGLYILDFSCKSWVANEFLDHLTCYDLPENGLDKLRFREFHTSCEPFEEEVVPRLANICSHLSYLEMSEMFKLSEAGRLWMVSLFRQIIQHNPPI